MASSGFSKAERDAMKQRAEELRAQGRKGAKAADEAQACLDAIEKLSGEDRAIAERLHALVTKVAPDLAPKTWYGFPSYAQEGKVMIFLKPAAKFGDRYATLGFNDNAQLDDGTMWAKEFAITTWDAGVEREVEALVTRAVGG
jgi:uncharacterized protein YdhG (YjbR/CyaY superfamily)